MANKLYLQENLLIYKPAAAAQFYSGVAGTGTIDLAAWITEAAADGTITIAGGGGGAVTSVAGRTGAVVLTKTDVGLSNVNNTSDAAKPISIATQAALDTKQATLVSGTNIKTVGGIDITGPGNIPFPTTTNSLYASGETIVSSVNGVDGFISPQLDTITKTLGFNSAGLLVKQVVSGGGGSTISQYSAGANVLVTASNTGITASKTGSAWTVTVPSGVSPISVSINVLSTDVSDTPDASGAADWVTVRFTGAGITSNSTFGTYKFPALTAHILPTGTIAVTNAGSTNTTATVIVGVGANEFTVRKANLSQTNDTVLTFTGF